MDKQSQTAGRSIKRLSTLEALQAPHERRDHLRAARVEHLFVQLSATLPGGEERRTLKCASADLSRGGLRLSLHDALPAGALLEIWIRLADTRRNYYLVGNVRWCVASGEGHQVGVELRDAPATDFQTWRRLSFG